MLAVAALLRPLGAEVGREVPALPRHRRAVLHERAHDRRGALGPQREPPAAAVVELVHLLADDVGALADAVEHLGVLEDRREHQAVAEAAGPVGEARRRAPASGPTPGAARRACRTARGRRLARQLGHDGMLQGSRPSRLRVHTGLVAAVIARVGTLFSAQVTMPHCDATGSRNFGGDRYFSRWS